MNKNDQLVDNAVGKLRALMTQLKKNDDKIFSKLVAPKDRVISRFQPIFSAENVAEISEKDFKDFLLFENNQHWTGLHRMGPKICSDMSIMRKSLAVLVDETKDISDRLNQTYKSVSGMGKAIITAILLVEFPDKYGVWNNTSEAGMKKLEIWPRFDKRESFGQRYIKVNQRLLSVSEKLNIDLWTLDALWDALSREEQILGPGEEPQEGFIRFGLEKHLQEFMRDNWDEISLGKEWIIYSEEGDNEAGYEYPCKIGRIDILARHRQKPKWLVIELKRDQTSDQTVGQALRYIGWVQENLAEPKDQVEGLIIAHQADEQLRYALKSLNNVTLQLYEVDFHLRPFKI